MSVNSLPVSNVKRKLNNRSPSGSTRYLPEEKQLRECKITEEERYKSDNSVEVLQEVQELDKMEKLVERVEQISAKLHVLDEALLGGSLCPPSEFQTFPGRNFGRFTCHCRNFVWWLVVRCNISSFMLSFQSRFACRNLP